MFRTALIASDLSPASDRVIDCLSLWRTTGLRKVVVAHVHNIRTSGGLVEILRREHEPKLVAQTDRIQRAGLHAEWRLEFGVPYVDLDRIAEQEGAEVMVIGSHGASWVKEVLLGSIADAILRYSRLPVLVMKVAHLTALPPPECDATCGHLFRRVLFATDFSDAAELALDWTAECARRMGSAVHVVHVQDTRRIDPHLLDRLEEFNRTDDLRLARVSEHLLGAGASAAQYEIALDHPVQGILEAAERWQASMLLLGRHGRGWLKEALLGSTAHQVARLSPVPVLLIPETAPR